MRRNDFFKSLLFSGGNPASHSELETETLPYTFNSNSYKLRNYRIYGNTVNGQSVGNPVTEGEHTGEYCIPVTINNAIKIIYLNTPLRKVSNEVEYIDYKQQQYHRVRKNLFNTTITKGSLTGTGDYVFFNGSLVSGFVELEPGNYTISCTGVHSIYIALYDYNKNYISRAGFSTWKTLPTTFKMPEVGYIRCVFKNDNSEPNVSDISNIQIEPGNIASEYEPYIENTEIPVLLPAIPTVDGTNIITVDTETQPSKIYLQGNIEEIETVSAEPVQTNVQSLQPLSLDDDDLQLDVMPTESDLQLDVIIPTANLNRIEDDEDAE